MVLSERFGAVRMSPDDWLERLRVDIWDEEVRGRIERIQGELTSDLLSVGASVVVEWGTWMRAERDALRESALRSGALAHLEFLDAPLEVLWQRVRSRGHEQRIGSRAVTHDDMVAWSATIERPNDNEIAGYDPLPPATDGNGPGRRPTRLAAGSLRVDRGRWRWYRSRPCSAAC
jgi:predicted kinase